MIWYGLVLFYHVEGYHVGPTLLLSWYGMVWFDVVVICYGVDFVNLWNDLTRHLAVPGDLLMQQNVNSRSSRKWCGWVEPASLIGRNHVTSVSAWVPPDDRDQSLYVACCMLYCMCYMLNVASLICSHHFISLSYPPHTHTSDLHTGHSATGV